MDQSLSFTQAVMQMARRGESECPDPKKSEGRNSEKAKRRAQYVFRTLMVAGWPLQMARLGSSSTLW